jgi:hypothetical protein
MFRCLNRAGLFTMLTLATGCASTAVTGWSHTDPARSFPADAASCASEARGGAVRAMGGEPSTVYEKQLLGLEVRRDRDRCLLGAGWSRDGLRVN